MKRLLLPFFAIIMLPLVLVAQSNQSFTAMDVFELQWVEEPQISPDGEHIVYSRGVMDKMKDRRVSRLWIMDADGSNHRKLTDRDVNEGSARWSPDGSRIAFTSSSEDDGSEIYVYWMQSRSLSRITQLEESPNGIAWSPDGKRLAFKMKVTEPNPKLADSKQPPKGAEWAESPRVTTRLNYESDGSGYLEPGFTHIFTVPAEGGAPRQITSGDYHYSGNPVWSADGERLIFSANLNEDWEHDRRESELYAVDVESGKIEQLTEREGPDYNAQVSPDGETIAYLGYDDKVQTYQLTELYMMDTDGENKRSIALNLNRSISSIQWDENGQGLYFMYDDEGNTKIGHATLDGQTTVVAHNVGGTTVARPYGEGSYSVADDGTIAYNETTPYYPAELATTTRDQDGRTKITGLNDALLDYRQLGEVEEIWYRSSVDGRQIQGWIVKPPNFDPNKEYPLVVENHGGPISNYGDRFSPEIQLYASAGYVVFYPNPRGSTGYGEEFGNLLYHDYPGDDYHDVMDGVDAVLKKGYLDEENLFVTGGSAGGTMTSWMVGKTDQFAASAVIKPVMNWISKTLTADNYYGYAHYRYPGQPWENFEAYWEHSPVSLVGNIETPTMVMVGTNDLRTPPSEAKQLYSALQLRKIETAYVELPGASHFISNRPSQLIDKVENIIAWFERYRTDK
ncbi:prolyl oligopeptidase family serine peptidase [Fodinibius sp. SL11]|uniref:prolyl oligopeptidase family serine peptidase n=1 Tax=Fodinibius sp. SL11 TaxID=3425690 RepID=UPI003F884066